MKGKGEYAADQKEIHTELKDLYGWRCERCNRPHDPAHGYCLTVHHLDGNKSNNEKWNLAVLCQRCHLAIQGKVFLPQSFMFEHSDWFKPHVDGYYNSLKIASGKNGA